MTAKRAEFSSRLGFIMAATGSAVGLGNIWGFPTNAAGNGGAAFLLVYLVLAFCLAYPALMAELIIGRHTQANIVGALRALPTNKTLKKVGAAAGVIGVLTSSAILSFYALVAGWMLSHLFSKASELAGLHHAAAWMVADGIARNLLFALIFSILTLMMVSEGVRGGIERWSTRMMPALVVLLVLMIGYVLFQPGAKEGLKVYLVPDFSRVFHPQLIISAMGQAFFSLSLGVGTMLIYGSYVSRTANLPALGAIVTLMDTGISVLAGLLILPAMFIAQRHGVDIYQSGQLIAGPDLIFNVLPSLFDTMGAAGHVFALVFFLLMTLAALTSSISMLEVPTAWLIESSSLGRKSASCLTAAAIFAVTTLIIFWFEPLFGWISTTATEYSEPLMGMVLCLFAGWAMHRDALLAELRCGNPDIEQSWFWRIWPGYVRVVCPLLIAAAFINSLL